ncbi:MAG TPA: hypothetical protein VFJ16_26830 [Longimicrobium sp.]|nr:hypothetical protein [Longimicrobium sp.]
METGPLPPRVLDAADDLAELVLGYLRQHPLAADTLRGIAEWWVPRQQIRVDVGKLHLALEQLVARGVVEAAGSGEQRRYRLAVRPATAGPAAQA